MTFGVLMSVYSGDQPVSLAACFESLLWQTQKPDAVCVVVEGELDPHVERVLAHYTAALQPPPHVLRIPKQDGPLGFGLPAALNAGLRALNTDWVLKVDSDDINVPERLEQTRSAVLGNPRLRLVGGQLQEWSEGFETPGARRSVPLSYVDVLKRGRWRNPVNGPTAAFHRQTALELGGFPEVGANEDYALWGRFLQAGKPTVNVPEVWVHQQAGVDLIRRRGTARYRRGELQALNDLRRIGWLPWGPYLFHAAIKAVVRRLPLAGIQYIYTHLRTYAHPGIALPEGGASLLQKAQKWQHP